MAVTAATPAPGRLAADRAGMAASSELMAGLPVVNAVLARLGFDAILTAWLPGPDPRCAMATATVIGVLVRNLALGREPLYGLAAWAARFDETLLGLAHGQAAMLDDDHRAGPSRDQRLRHLAGRAAQRLHLAEALRRLPGSPRPARRRRRAGTPAAAAGPRAFQGPPARPQAAGVDIDHDG